MDTKYASNYSSGLSSRPQTYSNFQSSTNRAGFQSSGQKQDQRPISSFYSNQGSSQMPSNQSYLNSSTNSSNKYGDSSNLNSYSKNSFSSSQQSGQGKGFNDNYVNQNNQQTSKKSLSNQYLGKGDEFSYKSNNSGQNYGANQDSKSKDENNLSWTKYIAMQFKIQQLQKLTEAQKQQIKQKGAKIRDLENKLNITKYQCDKSIKQLQIKYEKQLEDQKNSYQSQLSIKVKQLKNCLDKITDETKLCLAEQVKIYILDILNKNSQLKSEIASVLQEKEKAQKKIEQFTINQTAQQLITKQHDTIQKLTAELEQITQRFVTRITPSNDNNSFVQVLQTQATQINELRQNYDLLQNEYLRSRMAAAEAENKLKNFQNQQQIISKKQKLETNNLISELTFKITQKQHECSSLSRRLKSAQSRLKSTVEENKAKSHSIQLLSSKYQNAELENRVKQLITQFMFKTQDCLACLDKDQQIAKLQTKVNLLQN